MLDKMALDVFRMLPDSEKSEVEVVIAALRKPFKPGGMEELRGLEFHHQTQGDVTIASAWACSRHVIEWRTGSVVVTGIKHTAAQNESFPINNRQGL